MNTVLRSLTAGQKLSDSPLIAIVSVDNAADTVTILVRGSFTFSGITPFMRIEIVMARSDVDLTFNDAPLKIKNWNAVLGDVGFAILNQLWATAKWQTGTLPLPTVPRRTVACGSIK